MSPCQAEILRIVDEEILTAPEKWCQGAYSRDKRGRTRSAFNSEPDKDNYVPVAFCIMGAVYLAQRETRNYCPIDMLLFANGFRPTFNDLETTTFQDIKRKLAEMRALPVKEEL